MIGEREEDMKIDKAIYAILAFLILIPFVTDKYIFLLDSVPEINSNNLILYGKDIPIYGGSLPLYLTEVLISTKVFRITMLFIILFLSGYLMHDLIYHMSLSRIAGLYAGLLYAVNPFTYIRTIAGHWYISYALIPLSIKMFIELLEYRGKKEIIKFAFVLTVIGFSSHILMITLIALGLIFTFWLWKYRDMQIMKTVGVVIVLFLSLSSYWILPVITAKNTILDNINEKDYDAFSLSITDQFDIMVMYGFWRDGYLYARDFLPGWQILSLIIISLSIIGFLRYYNDKKIGIYVRAFAVIWIIGLILASGVHGPFGDIVRWLFDNTILKGFRDSQKFVSMIVLSYAVLGGLGIQKIKDIYDRM